MRHTYFLIILTGLFIMTTAHAQQPFQRELSVGGSFGAAFSSVSFVPRIQHNQLLTFNGGLTGRWITNRNVGLQVELNVVQHGWEEFFDDPQYYYRRRLNYIELPFFTHIYVGNRRVRGILNLGPQISYLLGENTDENVMGLDSNPEPNRVTEQHSKAVENKLGWGISGGPGIEIRTGIGHFILEGRYYYGLGDIYKSTRKDYFGKSSPQVITVKLTYLLPLSKK